jgi:hypothetical protein
MQFDQFKGHEFINAARGCGDMAARRARGRAMIGTKGMP